MMCTTCFATKRPRRRDRVDDRDRPLDRRRLDPDLLGELPVERVRQGLARLDAAARAAASPPARASRGGRGGCRPRQRRIAETRIRGSRHHAGRRAEAAPAPRSLCGSSSTSTQPHVRQPRRPRAARSASPARRRTARARSVLRRIALHLAAVAGVDQAGRVDDREPVPRGEPGARQDEARVARPGSRPRARCRRRPAPRARARPVRTRRGRGRRRRRRPATGAPRPRAAARPAARSRRFRFAEAMLSATR